MGKISTSGAFDSFSGSTGDQVVARTRGGLATRSKPKYKYPKIAAVQEGNDRLKAANAAWNEMSIPQSEAWNRYAEGLASRTGFDGTRYKMTGKNALVALTTKFLQANSGQPVPLDPPTGTYIGPDVTIDVGSEPSSSNGSFRRGGQGGEAVGPPSPAPSSKTNHLKEGVLTFSASGPTGTDTVVELLIQPLLNGKRSPTQFYKSAAFVTFDAAHLTRAVSLQAGWYAAAYRFVEKATGRSTMMQTLGKLEVS